MLLRLSNTPNRAHVGKPVRELTRPPFSPAPPPTRDLEAISAGSMYAVYGADDE